MGFPTPPLPKKAKKAATKTVSFRLPEKKPESPKKKIVIELTKEQQIWKWEETNEQSFLAILALLWEASETFRLLDPLLTSMNRYALREGDVQLKKKCMLWREGVAETTRKIVSLSSDGTGLSDMSFARFKRLLAGTASYTMFIKENLAETIIKQIFRTYHELSTGGPCSSSQNTMTTGTSCTTALSPVPNADVPEPRRLPVASVPESSDELFGLSSLPQTTASIQSSISALDGGRLVKFKSGTVPPGADSVVKLEIYPLEKVKALEPNQWWKHATLRSKCVTSSGAEVMDLVTALQKGMERHFKRNLAPLTREEKDIGTWRS
ncbi:hypothetical protein M8J77_017974 [Diaphorina citri]|nr:hypothetical protein M8J77_017974 [Diaphorina citri]